MSKYNEKQEMQISYYEYKIQQAWANREKHYAKELEEKLYNLKKEFDKCQK